MKKILTVIVAAATLLGAVSCLKTEGPVGTDGLYKNVTVGVKLPGMTKAIGDGLTANNLKYEVFYKGEDGSLTLIKDDQKDLSARQTTIEFTLMRDTRYVVLFWAEPKENSPYNSTDLQSIKMNYSNNAGNLETRDAFCGRLEFTVDDEDNKNSSDYNPDMLVILKRPFAQVNIVSEDYGSLSFEGEIANITLKSTAVTLSKLATEYNVYTGEATNPSDGNDTFTFNATGIGVDMNGDNNVDSFDSEEGHALLSMNYVLLPTVPTPATSIKVHAEFTVDVAYATGVTVQNYPVTVYDGTVGAAPNCRTIISGDIFTEGGKIGIELDNKFNADPLANKDTIE